MLRMTRVLLNYRCHAELVSASHTLSNLLTVKMGCRNKFGMTLLYLLLPLKAHPPTTSITHKLTLAPGQVA